MGRASELPYTSRLRLQDTVWIKMSVKDRPDIRLACLQGNQSAVSGVGDGDNSLSMRRVKSGS